MGPTLNLRRQCAEILREYLQGGGEIALQGGHELGRNALVAGMSIAEMAKIHFEALVSILDGRSGSDDCIDIGRRAGKVFSESLSTYEMTHRGLQEAHATLQESERRYREMVEVIPDVIFTLSLDGRVTSLNPAFESITGWSREEWLGKPLDPYIHPEDLPCARRLFERVLRRETQPIFELRVLAKSGEYLVKEMTATPVVREGEVVGVVGMARDITRRRRAEEALRSLFEGVPVGLCRVTPEGKILDANHALVEMLGYPDLQTLLAVNVVEFYVDPEDLPRFVTLMERGGLVRDFEVRFRRHDGTIFWVRKNSRAVRDAEGKAQCYENALEDITERKQAEIALRHLNEMLEEEAKRIAHALHDEAGQVLTSIHLDLETLARELPPAAQGRLWGVRGLLKQFEGHLRDLSHELRPTVLDDLGLMPALEFLAAGVSKRTGVQLAVDGMGELDLPPTIDLALYRIVQEGLTNMAKYAHATRVWIEVQRTDGLVRCSLRDNGVGFEVSSVLGRRGERGIGLVGMRERAEALGGTLRIRSAPGQGTELLVAIPLEQ